MSQETVITEESDSQPTLNEITKFSNLARLFVVFFSSIDVVV